MKNAFIILFPILFLISIFVEAHQDRRFTIGNTQYQQLHSEQTGRDHELIVFLPYSYHSSPHKKYPVFYYLDAYWDTGLLSGIYNNLQFDNVMPEIIMVGLSYPGENINYDTERLRDFTPSNAGPGAPDSGGAKKFLRFLQTEAVPHVEKNFRADASQRALGGVSLGGLFTLYAMYQNPEFFGRYISLSPAVEWDKQYFASVDNRFAKNNKTLNARLFLSYGTEEYQAFRDPIVKIQKQIADRKYNGLHLLNYKMEGLRHTSVKSEGYTRGLIWVWKDIAPIGPSGLEKIFLPPAD